MAAVPYDGTPSVAPSGNLPSNFLQVQDKVTPSVERLGAGLIDAGTAFTQASSDNAFNLYQRDVSNILRGAPATDGGAADTGYLGMNGRAALDARQTVEKKIADLRTKYMGDLGTNPLAQNQFDRQAQVYETQAFGTISSHATDQSQVWFTSVNKSSEDNAMARIAAAPLDLKSFAAASADLINARAKQAQLLGAQPGDPVFADAIATGKRDALKAQVLAVGARDPSSALRILQKNQAIAGPDYDNIYTTLRARADEQDGYGAADQALKTAADDHAATSGASYANPSLPIYQETAANIPGGMSAAGLARTVAIESGGDPNIANKSNHVGLGQFSADTAAQVGITDRTDPNQSIMGIQRYAAQNAAYLSKALGRPPTDAELYLAHQQGAGGAAKLLANPTALAASIVGTKAVIQNGGTQGMTAAQYVSMWAHKFGGTAPQGTVSVGANDNGMSPALTAAMSGPAAQVPPQPATPDVAPAVSAGDATTAPPVAPTGAAPPNLGYAQIKANALQAVLDNPNLTERGRAIAISAVNQRYAAMAAAESQTTAMKKAASDSASDQYVTKILTNDTAGLADTIARDPALDGDKKIALTNALLAHADQSATAAAAAYGSGFWKAYQQVSAPVGDASRIADMGDLLRRAGPGGDLTLAGVQKLSQIMSLNAKSVDQQAVNSTKLGLYNYAKSKLSFQQDTGPIQIKDPQGEQLFNAVFIPKFESSFDAWTKGGKDPYEFLTKDNIDKLMDGLRSPREMALAKITAEQGVDAGTLPAAPTPAGVDETGWKLVLNAPPLMPDGKQSAPDKWTAAVTLLQQQPTPERIAQFDKFFGASGVKAADILSVLGVAPRELTDAEKAAVAAKAKENPAYPGAHAIINGVEDLGLPLPAGQ